MKIWKITTLFLIMALIGTNGWWLHNAIDATVTKKYQDQINYERSGMLKQLISVMPELSSGKSKKEIVAIVKKSADLEPYEKEGVVWFGWTGLKFDHEDKLVKVISSRDAYN